MGKDLLSTSLVLIEKINTNLGGRREFFKVNDRGDLSLHKHL
jgi:hypothetical protein